MLRAVQGGRKVYVCGNIIQRLRCKGRREGRGMRFVFTRRFGAKREQKVEQIVGAVTLIFFVPLQVLGPSNFFFVFSFITETFFESAAKTHNKEIEREQFSRKQFTNIIFVEHTLCGCFITNNKTLQELRELRES